MDIEKIHILMNDVVHDLEQNSDIDEAQLVANSAISVLDTFEDMGILPELTQEQLETIAEMREFVNDY